MKPFATVLLIATLGLASCTQVQGGLTTACADVARLPPAAVATLDAQDPHSALGVLWADAKAACVAGVPAIGVGESFGAMVWGELKVLIPQLLPQLIPILIGLL